MNLRRPPSSGHTDSGVIERLIHRVRILPLGLSDQEIADTLGVPRDEMLFFAIVAAKVLGDAS